MSLQFVVLVLVGPAVAKGLFSPDGINNRGSSLCRKGSMAEISQFIANGDIDNQRYFKGHKIACSKIGGGVGGTCAFFQEISDQGVSGRETKELIKRLAEHKDTDACGSIPLSILPEHGGINKLDKMGYLTVNFVKDTDNPCPPGLCDGSPARTPLDQLKCAKPISKDTTDLELAAPAVGNRSVSRIYGRAPEILADVVAEVGQQMQIGLTGSKPKIFQISQIIADSASALLTLPNTATTPRDLQGVMVKVADAMSITRPSNNAVTCVECTAVFQIAVAQSGNFQIGLSEAEWRRVIGSAVQYIRQRGNGISGARFVLALVSGAGFVVATNGDIIIDVLLKLA